MPSTYLSYTGIVFRLLDAKAEDRVIYLLTDEGEKLVFVAKGVRKAKSRKAHALDLLNVVNMKVADTGRGMPVITDVKLLENYLHLKQDFVGLMFVSFICDVIGKYAQEGQESKGLYNNIILVLQGVTLHRYALLAATIILRLLYASGDLPKLDEDVHTGQPIESEAQRAPAEVIGYTATSGAAQDFIPDRLYKTQRFILKADFTQVEKITLTPQEELQLLELHIRWLQNVTESHLKSAPLFLQALQQ